MLVKILSCSILISPAVATKEVIDCKKARIAKLQADDIETQNESDRRLIKSSLFQHASEKQASGRFSNIIWTY
jgi:hypothetical protein